MTKRHHTSDKQILSAIRTQDPQGWTLFREQFDPMIQSIVRRPRWKFSEPERQDVYQNIYLQLQKALPGFKGHSSLTWYIKRICHHQCVDEVRRQVTRRTWTVLTAQPTPDDQVDDLAFSHTSTRDPYKEIVLKERRHALRAALEHLQESCQHSIHLFYTKGLSYQEISKHLGISINTVGSRLSKCLSKLQHELQKKNLPTKRAAS